MRNQAIVAYTALVGLCLLFSDTLPASDMNTAVGMALERDEGLQALDQRRLGLKERSVADGALPDPEIMIGAEGVPVTDPFNADMMTMYKVGMRQRFPAGSTRELARERTLHQADGLDADLQARRLDIARQTRLAWLEWATAWQSLELAREAVEAFAELNEITMTRYRAGTGRQRDVDQARMELAMLERRVLVKKTRLDEASSRLTRWTGQQPSGVPDLPADAEMPARNLDELSERLHRHPLLQASDYRIEAGVTDTRLARQAYRPSWMVEAGYAHTRGMDPMTMSRQSDKLFAMVSFSIPLFTANRQDRRLTAARSELEALNHDRGLELQQMQGELDRQHSAWHRLTEQVEWLETRVLSSAEATVESTLSAYRADRATFDELVRAVHLPDASADRAR
jgi:outer membrane protein TolC